MSQGQHGHGISAPSSSESGHAKGYSRMPLELQKKLARGGKIYNSTSNLVVPLFRGTRSIGWGLCIHWGRGNGAMVC